MTAALYFAPDAYMLNGNQIMGRRTAGAAFLRAAVEGRGAGPLIAYARDQKHGEMFGSVVRSIDPAAQSDWIRVGRHDLVARLGALHRPDPAIGLDARTRLRSGPAAFSLTGITHSISSARTLDAIVGYLSDPVMPWDALICTSTVAAEVVRSALEQAESYMAWRLGARIAPARPQLPVIPLGIHSQDWAVSEEGRQAARQRLAIDDGEVALLFAGRLAYASKAHPFQMLDALRSVADASDRPLRLLLAGQFFNATIEREFLQNARDYCPNLRTQHVDGADAGLYAAAYAAADIFVSLSDNIQETFGITPLEAMAAGLPVVVSDWNGYRDTVRDGIDGFRIPCWAPMPGAGHNAAHAYEILGDYDLHTSRTSTTVSIDMACLVDRLITLVAEPELRRRMGEAGRAHAAAAFDWAVIYPRYLELWQELGAIRRHESSEAATAGWLAAAPRAHPTHDDPFNRFASYPSHFVTPETLACAAPGASRTAYEVLTGKPMFAAWRMAPDLAERIIAAASDGPVTVGEIARRAGLAPVAAIEPIARLAKMNLLLLEARST